MSNAEFTAWIAYRVKHGPLSYERRYDRPAALQSHVAARIAGGHGDMDDFQPWPVKPVLNDVDAEIERLTALISR